MVSILNLLIFSVMYAFLFASGINFFSPITIPAAIVILLLALTSAYVSRVFIPFTTFAMAETKRPPNILMVACLVTFGGWAFIVTGIPSTNIDANVYHLPLSLLMNHSIWYPGLAKLSSHFGFPNGTSVLASLFTCFDTVGLEHIPNVVIWTIFGTGIFLYLRTKTDDLLISIPASLLFLFTPRLFLESYNMGTDLPVACFLTFGLLALAEKKLDEACILLSLAAVFKSLGVLAAGLVVPYALFVYGTSGHSARLSVTKITISLLLLLMSFTRVYIATGNPFYPSWPLNLGPWGISEDIQRGLIDGTGIQGADLTRDGLRNYSGVERSVSGLLEFVKDFIFFPHAVKSEYWFSPFLLVCLAIVLYHIWNKKYHRGIQFNSLYTYFVVTVLIAAWFYFSPLFRFIVGVLVFVNIRLLILAMGDDSRDGIKMIVRGAAIGTLLLFLVNAAEHIIKDIIPLASVSEASVEQFMPWMRRRGGVETEFETKRTADGFVYSKSTSNYCQRLKPPCINGRSLGEEEQLIGQFRKYNKI